MPRIVFLTRGDSALGMGHLHRVSWLVEALAAGRPELELRVHCVDTREARQFWQSHSASVHFLASYNDAAEGLKRGDCAVVDWLDSPVILVKQVAQAVGRGTAGGGRMLLLDEYGPGLYQADVVVNALLSPLPRQESVERGVRVVSGVDYVQLPLQAVRLRGIGTATANAVQTLLDQPVPKTGPVRAVVVSFGGSPRQELIELALRALSLARYTGAVLLIPAPAGLQEQLGADQALQAAGMHIECLPASEQFHDLLAAADLAILGGGLSLYEAACHGVPAVCLPVVEHQLDTVRKLERAGCCRLGGMPQTVNSEELAVRLRGLIGSSQLRGRMSFRGQRLVDGRGLQRTVDIIHQLVDEIAPA